MKKELVAYLLRLPPGFRPLLGPSEPDLEKVAEKLQELLPLVRGQQRKAEALVQRLLRDYRPDQRKAAIRRSKKFHSWAVVQRLCLRSRETVYTDAEEAVHLGRLATEAALQVPNDLPGLGDLLALCLATTANGHRVLRSYAESSHYFGEAYEHLSREGGDRYARAEVFSLHASLLKDLKLYKEALAVLDQAVQLYHAEGDESRLARRHRGPGGAFGRSSLCYPCGDF